MPARQKGNKMTLLDVQHVKKIYKTRFQGSQVEALKDIHFTVEKGEYVSVVGENGCGKSTLVRLLLKLLKPTSGSIEKNVQGIGYVPQKKINIKQ